MNGFAPLPQPLYANAAPHAHHTSAPMQVFMVFFSKIVLGVLEANTPRLQQRKAALHAAKPHSAHAFVKHVTMFSVLRATARASPA